jgi:hypothetical protein
MKKVIIALLCVVGLFTGSAMASEFGWKALPAIPGAPHLIGMTNRGEQGGELALICNTQTHKLNLTYNGGGKQYDVFVFRKFGVTDMNTQDRAGKFIVGMMGTTQSDVYYNVLNADKAFVVARFPIGTKAAYDKAIANNATNMPAIQQEGDEFFLVGDDWKKLLKDISVQCPVNFDKDKVIF